MKQKLLNSHYRIKVTPSTMRSLKVNAIIHIFAIIHVMVTLLCRISGIDDSLMLTLLTMMMTVIVCFRRGLSVEFTAASVVIVNIAGYLIGIGGAQLIGLVSDSKLLVHSLSTFCTTEILGWSVIGISKLFRIGDKNKKLSWTPRIRWLVLAVIVIFAIRMAYTEIFNSRHFSAESIYRIIKMLTSNSVAILLLICINIIYVRFMRIRLHGKTPAVKTAVFPLFIISAAGITAVISGFNLPFRVNYTFTSKEFLLLFAVSMLAEFTVYCITYMADYTISTRSAMFKEREKAHQAQFQYMKLKQQVNPHFLFNSLNILDCLVCEEKTEQASAYIHKLANLYRYLLQNESEDHVHLEDELTFVKMYMDLLSVRFPEGIVLNTYVPAGLLRRSVVPCSIQLLVENAIKHNIASKETPLEITISADSHSITISNNINPKLSSVHSTKVGQNYIRQQYLDLTGRHIEIQSDSRNYRVTLPLI